MNGLVGMAVFNALFATVTFALGVLTALYYGNVWGAFTTEDFMVLAIIFTILAVACYMKGEEGAL